MQFRMRPAVLFVLFLGTSFLPGQVPPAAAPLPPGSRKPLPPEEASKAFRLPYQYPTGYRIELVAAEPQIESPVAMAFDARGRLWVVEMRDYPNGPAAGEKPAGRIRILEDANGDGFFEKSSIWAENLLFANGLLPWKDGAIVTMAPHIVHLRDTDGDGRADRQDVLYEGFIAQNPQLRVSHPLLGTDGWVYVANGLRGGTIRKAGDKGPGISISGLDFRFDPLGGGGEAISGPGQYGQTFDDWGRRFVCDNRHHLRQVVLENRYVKRNPLLAVPALVEDISVLEGGPLSSGGKIYPLSKNWTTSNLHEGRFTAACGVFVYRGKLMPQLNGIAFTCDPTGNLVHGERMTGAGPALASRPLLDRAEFLATPDDWCRPVFLTSGPEGALYVVDMYRAVIEHPDFMPVELKKRPDLLLGKDRGRIWRIVPKNHEHRPWKFDLAKETTAGLVALLEHEEPWWRGTAQRLLLERQDPGAIEPLRNLFDKTTSPHALLHAAWLLEKAGKLSDAAVLSLLEDKRQGVRLDAVLLAEPRAGRNPKVVAALAESIRKRPQAEVNFRIALALGEVPGKEAVEVLAELAAESSLGSWTRQAIFTSLHGRMPEFLQAFVQRLAAGKRVPLALIARQEFLREFFALAGASNDADLIGTCLRTLEDLKGSSGDNQRRSALVGLLDGLERRGGNLGSLKKKLPAGLPAWAEGLMKEAFTQAADRRELVNRRLAAIRLLGQGDWEQVKRPLTALLLEDPDQAIRIAAVGALSQHGDPEVAGLLLREWRAYTPGVRRAATEALFRRTDRVQALVDGLGKGVVKAGDLDALRTRQLLNHGNPAIRKRAQELLRAALPEERVQALKTYRAALDRTGDAARGLEVFKKHCAICHKVGGIGTDVGPDISDTRTKTAEALLTDILSPNAAIDNNYVQYLATTKSGKSLTGVLAAETASSITLKRQEGQQDVVLRSDLETLASTGVSLMPEGLEKNISLPEMADLLAYLKNWRYVEARK